MQSGEGYMKITIEDVISKLKENDGLPNSVIVVVPATLILHLAEIENSLTSNTRLSSLSRRSRKKVNTNQGKHYFASSSLKFLLHNLLGSYPQIPSSWCPYRLTMSLNLERKN